MSSSNGRQTVLIIDDDELFGDATRDYLQRPGLEVLVSHTGADGLAVCSSQRIDVVLLDRNLPDAEGHTLCPDIMAANDQTKIVFITAHPSFDSAVDAMRAGAYDYLSKPFEPEELRHSVDRALRTLELENVEDLARYRSQKERMETVLVGADGGLASVAELISLAAEAEAPVLITGETGTGKNVAARAIHYASPRHDAPFITVNCAALPENLIEAELFGFEKGAFTGAAATRRGVFEMASGGTLFLDEIGEMPLHLQAKLLGVLEDRELRRLGGESTRSVDVHVVAATAADLEDALDSTFRRDLYFRLSVMRIHLPPLRNHAEDIAALCEHFLTDLRGSNAPTISDVELERLRAYSWPGNVREMRNILERATILQRGAVLAPSKLLGGPMGAPVETTAIEGTADPEEIPTLEAVERDHIRFALEALDYNYTHTADALGVAISTLKRKIRKYDLSSPR